MATPTYEFFTPSPILAGLESAVNSTRLVSEEFQAAEDARNKYNKAADVLEQQGFFGDAEAHRALAQGITPNFSKAIRDKKTSDFGVSKLTDNLLKVFSDERRNDAMAERQRNQIGATNQRAEFTAAQQRANREAQIYSQEANRFSAAAQKAEDDARRAEREGDPNRASESWNLAKQYRDRESSARGRAQGSIGSAPGTIGKVTSYAYNNDETPDTNSSLGIGAFVPQSEQSRIRSGQPSEYRLRRGDFAVSRDVEKRLIGQGYKPGDTVTINFDDGTSQTGRWMDRTAETFRGRDVTGRVDFYMGGGSGLHEKEGAGVVSFSSPQQSMEQPPASDIQTPQGSVSSVQQSVSSIKEGMLRAYPDWADQINPLTSIPDLERMQKTILSSRGMNVREQSAASRGSRVPMTYEEAEAEATRLNQAHPGRNFSIRAQGSEGWRVVVDRPNEVREITLPGGEKRYYTVIDGNQYDLNPNVTPSGTRAASAGVGAVNMPGRPPSQSTEITPTTPSDSQQTPVTPQQQAEDEIGKWNKNKR